MQSLIQWVAALEVGKAIYEAAAVICLAPEVLAVRALSPHTLQSALRQKRIDKRSSSRLQPAGCPNDPDVFYFGLFKCL